MEEWISLLGGQLSEEATESLLSRTAEDLDARLKAQPELGEYILELLDKRLGDKPDMQTWQLLDSSLSNYLGRDLAYLIVWLVQADQSERLDELGQYASPQAMAFLRTILGLYHVELRRALMAWIEMPDNWDTFTREVYYDEIAVAYKMQVHILKYNGEEVFVEGPADSMLALTSQFVRTVSVVGTTDAFDEDNVDQFLDDVDEFLRLLPPERLDQFIAQLREEIPEGA